MARKERALVRAWRVGYVSTHFDDVRSQASRRNGVRVVSRTANTLHVLLEVHVQELKDQEELAVGMNDLKQAVH